jgi:hypothetical protein
VSADASGHWVRNPWPHERRSAADPHPRDLLESARGAAGPEIGGVMIRYFYGWLPFVFLATIFILCAPWLGVIALLVLLFALVGVLGAMVWATVVGLSALGRAVARSLKSRPASPPVALSPRSVEAHGTR